MSRLLSKGAGVLKIAERACSLGWSYRTGRTACVESNLRSSSVMERFVTGISSADSPLGVLQSLGGDQRAQLTAKMMFTLAHKHGDVMKEGWKQLVDCSLILYKTGLMPPSMTTADDFVETKGCVSIARRPQENNAKAEHGLLSSIVSYITSSESAAQKEQEAHLRKVAQTCVINFHPEFIFSESTFLRTSALEELVRVLISSCPVPPSHSFVNDTGYDEESTVFALELLVKVVLKNKDRIHTIWTPVRDHLFALVMGAAASDYRCLLERSVVGMLRVALRLCKGDNMGSQVLQSLSMLLLLKPLTIRAVAKQVRIVLQPSKMLSLLRWLAVSCTTLEARILDVSDSASYRLSMRSMSYCGRRRVV